MFYCEGPGCGDQHDDGLPVHAITASPYPHLPMGFIETRQRQDGEDFEHHFCSWDCLMKYAAQHPPPEMIEVEDPGS
jgi:hypothetical protein